MTSILITGLPKKSTLKNIKTFFKGCKITNIKTSNRGGKLITFKNEIHAKNALKYDQAIFGSKYVKIRMHDDSSTKIVSKKNDNSSNIHHEKKRKEKVVDPPPKDVEEEIKDTCRLFVRKIDFTATKEDVTKLFESFGTLMEVSLPYDPVLKQICGYGFITYELASSAINAYRELHGKKFMCHKIFITAAREKPEPEESEQIVKDKTMASVKENSIITDKIDFKDTLNNLLNDKVIQEFVAYKNDISKSDLDNSSKLSSLSVNYEQARDLLFASLRKFFNKNQVDLENIEKSRLVSRNKPGSFKFFKTKFLVKNLLFGTNKNELLELFKKHNGFVKLNLAKHGLLAIVEYDTPENTDAAYLETMNIEFNGTSLYLQWLTEKHEDKVLTKRKSDDDISAEAPEPKKQKVATALSVPSNSVSTTILIKNISFQSTYKDLLSLFDQNDGFVSLKLPTKASGAHKGYAFCEFKSDDCAEVTMQKVSKGIDLFGRKLVFDYSTKKT